MAHAGEEVIFRAVQLLDLFFLLLGEGVLLFIHPIQEHEQDTGQQADHDHREGRVEKGVMLLVLSDQLRVIKGHAVANQGFQRTEYKKRIPALPLQGDADIDKAKDEPFRHSAVKPARCKKADGKQRQKQHRNNSGPCMNTFLLNAEFDNQRHSDQVNYHDQNVP